MTTTQTKAEAIYAPRPPKDGDSVMAVLGRSGDTKTIWDPANEDEVGMARKTFNELVGKKKYLAFRVNPDDGSKGEQIRTFDPNAGKIILAPAMKGGQG